jgi:chromosome segregation ATPase
MSAIQIRHQHFVNDLQTQNEKDRMKQSALASIQLATIEDYVSRIRKLEHAASKWQRIANRRQQEIDSAAAAHEQSRTKWRQELAAQREEINRERQRIALKSEAALLQADTQYHIRLAQLSAAHETEKRRIFHSIAAAFPSLFDGRDSLTADSLDALLRKLKPDQLWPLAA